MTEEYYIVSVKCRQMKAYDGSILTQEGDEVWLGESEGYRQLGTKACAIKYHNIPSQYEINKFDGMPWYNRMIPDSQKVFKVKHTKISQYQEVEIDPAA